METGKYYTVKGCGLGIDGLDVLVDSVEPVHNRCLIVRIRDRRVLFGDRLYSVPIASGTLFVHSSCLVECPIQDEPEFAHDNPYGRFVSKTESTAGDLTFVAARFDGARPACVVTARDVVTGKTVLSKNFYGRAAEDAYGVVARPCDTDDGMLSTLDGMRPE